MVLLSCRGNAGCSGPQGVVFDSGVFTPYHCFGVPTSDLHWKEGGRKLIQR